MNISIFQFSIIQSFIFSLLTSFRTALFELLTLIGLLATTVVEFVVIVDAVDFVPNVKLELSPNCELEFKYFLLRYDCCELGLEFEALFLVALAFLLPGSVVEELLF